MWVRYLMFGISGFFYITGAILLIMQGYVMSGAWVEFFSHWFGGKD